MKAKDQKRHFAEARFWRWRCMPWYKMWVVSSLKGVVKGKSIAIGIAKLAQLFIGHKSFRRSSVCCYFGGIGEESCVCRSCHGWNVFDRDGCCGTPS
jgi:hypothetical protein